MSAATRVLGSGAFTSVSVGNTGGGTAGVDLDLTAVSRSTGVTHTLAVTSSSTAYGALEEATPGGVFFRLTLREPTDTTTAVSSVVMQALETDAGTAALDDTVMEFTVLRDGGTGDYTIQSAPVTVNRVLPLVSQPVIAASGTQSPSITDTGFTPGGTSPPLDRQTAFALRFEGGFVQPGVALFGTIRLARTAGTGAIQLALVGRNTTGGSTAVEIVRMPGNSSHQGPMVEFSVAFPDSTTRTGVIDHSNSGSSGTNGLVPATVPGLDTNDEWELFMCIVNDLGATVYVANALRVDMSPTQVAEGVSLYG